MKLCSPPPSLRSSLSRKPSSSSLEKMRSTSRPSLRRRRTMVENPDPDRGQFSSLQVGLREVLDAGFNAAMITLVDCPPLSSASMDAAVCRLRQALARGKWGVAPEKDGRHGHPMLVSRNMIDAFLAAPVTSNARQVKWANPQAFEYIPVPDSLLTIDVNTPEEYAALATQPDSQKH